jgi:transcriptional regulator with XRE-family HTH domain
MLSHRVITLLRGYRKGASVENDLRLIRKHKKLSIRDVEAGTGVTRGRLSEIERGIRKPSLDERLAIDDFLEQPVKYWYKIPADPSY